jgi:hypothetical protein
MSLKPIYRKAYSVRGSYLDKSGKAVHENWRTVYAANMSEAKKLYKEFLTKKLHYTKVKVIFLKEI